MLLQVINIMSRRMEQAFPIVIKVMGLSILDDRR